MQKTVDFPKNIVYNEIRKPEYDSILGSEVIPMQSEPLRQTN